MRLAVHDYLPSVGMEIKYFLNDWSSCVCASVSLATRDLLWCALIHADTEVLHSAEMTAGDTHPLYKWKQTSVQWIKASNQAPFIDLLLTKVSICVFCGTSLLKKGRGSLDRVTSSSSADWVCSCHWIVDASRVTKDHDFCWVTSLFRLKYLNTYWIYYYILFIYFFTNIHDPQRMNHTDFSDCLTFNVSSQQLNELPWNLVQTFVVPSRFIWIIFLIRLKFQFFVQHETNNILNRVKPLSLELIGKC